MLRRLFGRGGDDEPAESASEISPESEQAVLVYLDGQNLRNEVYEEYDLATLEDQLVEVIEREGVGEFDGNDIGPGEVILYMYGPDAERLYAGIEQTLRDYPLCESARIVIRTGGPGAVEREVRL